MRLSLSLSLSGTVLFGSTLGAQTPEYHPASTVPATSSLLVFDSTRGRTIAVEQSAEQRLWEWNGSSWARLDGAPPASQSPLSFPAAAVYDPHRELVVTIHGDRVCEWDGARWTTRLASSPVAGPCAYDTLRRRIVVPVDANEVREWDGAQWLTIPAAGPSLRSEAAFAYDPIGGRCVLYGGQDGFALLSDCWSWDGAAWTLIAANAPPGPLVSASLAHEPTTGRMILSSGLGNDTTWQLQGNVWTQVPTATTPGERQGASMVWDGIGLLFRGGPSIRGGETWRFANNGWQELDAGAPIWRSDARICWDTVRNEGVWFGTASVTPGLTADTWTFDGRWHHRNPATSPGAVQGALRHLAFSSVEGEALLFGGPGDTWSWTGTTWRQRTPANSPSTRFDAVMVADPSTGVLLFGGATFNNGVVVLGDQWHWDGTNWQQQTPPALPSPRSGALAVLDARRNVVVVAGGGTPTTTLDETWEWDGVLWTQHAPMPFTPTGGERIAFRYETGRVFVEAQSRFEWDGVGWSPVGSSFPPLFLPTLMADPLRGRLLAVGLSGADTSVFTALPADAARYGNGCAIGQAPALTTIGRPEPGQAGFAISARTFASSAPTLIAFGLASAGLPLGSGCNAHVGSVVGVRFLTSSAFGEARVAMPLPADPGLLGFTFFAQAAVVDPPRGLFGGLTISDGLAITIGN